MSPLNSEQIRKLEKIVIYPGEYFVSSRPVMINTLLGSCVAACLFDPVNRVLGMNHFLLSNRSYQTDSSVFATPSGRYGVHAMELLINQMIKQGADRKYLKAKAFGGASLQGFGTSAVEQTSIGEANQRFVEEYLETENIPLLAKDLGGSRGRTIYFVSLDYSVYVRKHLTNKSRDLIREETAYREKLQKEQEKKSENIALWE